MYTGEIMATDRLQGINYARMREYRLNRTKEMMKKYGIGTLVTWDAWDIRYISSAYATVPCRWFEGTFVVLPVNGEPYVYAQTSFDSNCMRAEMPWLKNLYPTVGSTKLASTADHMKGVLDAIESVVREHGLANEPVGLDGCTSELLVSASLGERGLKCVDGKHCMFMARMIKNEDELGCCRMACACADAAFMAVKNALKPGVKECELVGVGMERLYALGCDETQEFVVASGKRTNPLHIDYTDKIIQPGDLVCVDINGASWQGYKSCYYRTFSCGKASQRQKDLFYRSRDMMYGAMAQIKAGASVRALAEAFPNDPSYWGLNNWNDANGYAIAHGLGISLHEYPTISYVIPTDDDCPTFEEDMFIAVETWVGEPGGPDGVRLEEDVIVTKDGYELVTKWPIDELEECLF